MRPPRPGRALGLDLGASHLAAALVDANGNMRGWRHRPVNPADGPERITRQAAGVLEEFLRETGGGPVAGLGVGLPGLVDRASGRLTFAPNLKWRDFPVRERLAAALGIPMNCDNDARLATLGEALFGAGRGCTDFLGVWIGTGIGGGMVMGGELFRGPAGSAGEIGHVTVVEAGPACNCGSRGCLEAMVAGPALAAQGREALQRAVSRGLPTPLRELCHEDGGQVTARLVAAAAARGDPEAVAILERAGSYLGIALAAYCNLCNPQRVVVGGGVAGAGDHLLEPARRELARRAMVVPRRLVHVVPSELGEAAVVIGAGALVLGDY